MVASSPRLRPSISAIAGFASVAHPAGPSTRIPIDAPSNSGRIAPSTPAADPVAAVVRSLSLPWSRLTIAVGAGQLLAALGDQAHHRLHVAARCGKRPLRLDDVREPLGCP